MLGRVGGVNGSERVIGYRPNAVERHCRGRGYCMIYRGWRMEVGSNCDSNRDEILKSWNVYVVVKFVLRSNCHTSVITTDIQ